MNDNFRVDSLILLVGSNPLPNYLAAMALKPSKIYLVYSNQTERPKQRLYEALGKDLSSATINGDTWIEDAFSASAVGDKIRDLIAKCGAAHLHYTGGTKVMSAHALKTFCDKGGPPENASYLDEANARLRFDGNREPKPLSECGVTLTLARILQLHHIDPLKPRECPTTGWIEKVAKKEIACKGSAAGVVTDDEKSKWRLFLTSEWLEVWTRLRILELLPAGFQQDQIRSGLSCTRGADKRKLEVDVAFVHRHRTFVVSCATTDDLGKCKQKAFEVAVRSRQLAGDLARSALVCFLDGVDNNEGMARIDMLKNDVEDVWGDPQTHPTTTRIFGLEDIKTWSGACGSPNLGSLKNWLDC